MARTDQQSPLLVDQANKDSQVFLIQFSKTSKVLGNRSAPITWGTRFDYATHVLLASNWGLADLVENDDPTGPIPGLTKFIQAAGN